MKSQPPNDRASWCTQKLRWALFCILTLLAIGSIDYLVDYRISLLACYVLPVGFAAIYVGPYFATILAILAAIIWRVGNALGGAPYYGLTILIYNLLIVLVSFLIVIYLLHSLNQMVQGLEKVIQEKLYYLHREMHERRHLEKKLSLLSGDNPPGSSLAGGIDAQPQWVKLIDTESDASLMISTKERDDFLKLSAVAPANAIDEKGNLRLPHIEWTRVLLAIADSRGIGADRQSPSRGLHPPIQHIPS